MRTLTEILKEADNTKLVDTLFELIKEIEASNLPETEKKYGISHINNIAGFDLGDVSKRIEYIGGYQKCEFYLNGRKVGSGEHGIASNIDIEEILQENQEETKPSFKTRLKWLLFGYDGCY